MRVSAPVPISFFIQKEVWVRHVRSLFSAAPIKSSGVCLRSAVRKGVQLLLIPCNRTC